MTKLIYAPSAKKDILEINRYITVELNNPDAADRIIQYIHDRISQLQEFPEMGPKLVSIMPESKLNLLNKGYRFLVCDGYTVYYQLSDDSVEILRVLYSRQDYSAILFGNNN